MNCFWAGIFTEMNEKKEKYNKWHEFYYATDRIFFSSYFIACSHIHMHLWQWHQLIQTWQTIRATLKWLQIELIVYNWIDGFWFCCCCYCCWCCCDTNWLKCLISFNEFQTKLISDLSMLFKIRGITIPKWKYLIFKLKTDA